MKWKTRSVKALSIISSRSYDLSVIKMSDFKMKLIKLHLEKVKENHIKWILSYQNSDYEKILSFSMDLRKNSRMHSLIKLSVALQTPGIYIFWNSKNISIPIIKKPQLKKKINHYIDG